MLRSSFFNNADKAVHAAGDEASRAASDAQDAAAGDVEWEATNEGECPSAIWDTAKLAAFYAARLIAWRAAAPVAQKADQTRRVSSGTMWLETANAARDSLRPTVVVLHASAEALLADLDAAN